MSAAAGGAGGRRWSWRQVVARLRRQAVHRGRGYHLIVHLEGCEIDEEGECTCRPRKQLIRP